jgi:hypothetical protein
MAETTREKLAREMTHWAPVDNTGQRLPDWLGDIWNSMNTLQRLSLLPVPIASDLAGLAGDVQMYAEDPETRGMGNYAMSALGLLPFVPAATTKIVGGKKVAARNLKGQRHSVAKNTVRNLDPEEMLGAARRGVHLKQDPKTGQYIGGPRGIDSPAKLAQMRKQFDILVEAGAGGGDWYQRVHDAVKEVTGGDPKKMSRMFNELAITSPQATPETNLGFALAGHNAYEAGVPAARMRTGAIAANYNAARDAGTLAKTGPKTGVYQANMETGGKALVPTNDIWHARSFGYVGDNGKAFSRGLTDTEHAFLDAETLLAVNRANQRKLGGRSDWTTGEIQAAPWVKQRADKVFKDKKGKLSWAEAFDEANKTYPDYFAKHAANATHESVPYRGANHLPGLLEADDATRAAFGADPRSTWATAPGGRDGLYDEAGMYALPTTQATGNYTPPGGVLEVNPAEVAHPLVSFTPSVKGVKEINPVDADMLKAIEAVRGYVGVQGAAPVSMPVLQTRAGANRSAFFPTGEPLTRQQLVDLKAVAGEYGLEPIDYGTGVLLANNADIYAQPVKIKSGAEMGKAIKGTRKEPGLDTKIAGLFSPDTVLKRTDMRSIYPGYEDAFASTEPGAVTRQLMQYLDEAAQGAPGTVARLEQSAVIPQRAAALAARDADWAAKLNTPVNPLWQNARDVLSRGGIPLLRETLRRAPQTLPALMLPGLLFGLWDRDEATI